MSLINILSPYICKERIGVSYILGQLLAIVCHSPLIFPKLQGFGTTKALADLTPCLVWILCILCSWPSHHIECCHFVCSFQPYYHITRGHALCITTMALQPMYRPSILTHIQDHHDYHLWTWESLHYLSINHFLILSHFGLCMNCYYCINNIL